ncbi:MAG: glycosyltransferase family 4 protein [Anaerolineae bacterium]|nr:glycosyltransferase family 4 protein [Anaerolineae bacterium]
MRVGFLTPEVASSYGWARYALELAGALQALGVEVVALTRQHTIPPDIPIPLRPVLPSLVPQPRGFLARSLLAGNRTRRAAQDCDLLHVIAEPYAPLAAWIAGDRPLVVTAHGTYVPKLVRRRLAGPLYKWALADAHLIAVSDYTAAQVRAALPGADPTVIRNGVHFDRFQVPAPVPVKHGPTVLASGGVKERKGTHLLIEALAQVREQVPDAQLVVTGRQDNPAYLDEVRARITRLGLEGCVHLVGQIPEADLLGWYQHADLFALPSLNVGDKFEGFGLVFLEASASGLPVVGTTGSGVEEAVIAGETGLLVPQDDAPALAGAITRLLVDDALRVRMGTTGRVYAQTQDWSAVAARVLALYEQIMR